MCFNQPGKEHLGTVGAGTAGIPVEGTDIQLWDEDHQIVAEGQIVVRGPQVIAGY